MRMKREYPAKMPGTPKRALFGDMAADPAEWQEAKSKTDKEPQGSDVAEQQAGPPEDLKVVVSIREGRATIGVQRPSSDPHIESFDEPDPSELVREVSAVIERASARWEEAPKYPAHARPASPARRRRDRAGGCHQDGRMYRGFLHFGLEPGEAPRDRTGWKCAPWFGSVLGPQWRSNPLVSISGALSRFRDDTCHAVGTAPAPPASVTVAVRVGGRSRGSARGGVGRH